MKFQKTPIADLFLIEPEPREDERGFFARVFCIDEFAKQGLCTNWLQANIAYNKFKGITRGMHYQHSPNAEVKLVRCTKGSVFDVVVDMRSSSTTYRQWFGAELTESNQHMLYIPEGFAHGYQVLENNSELHYMVSARYAPESEDGVRWNDPIINIDWPIRDAVQLSEKDEQWSPLQ